MRLGTSVLFLFVAVAGSWAQTAVLSLDDCLRMGIASSAMLRAGDAAVEETEGRLAEARYRAIPSLSLSASYARLSDIESGTITATNPATGLPFAEISLGSPILDSVALRLSVQQPVFAGFGIRSAAEQAKAMLDATLGDRARIGQGAVAAIEDAYWSATGAREASAAYAEYVDQARIHLNDAKNLLGQGLVTRNDVLKAEMRLSEAETRAVEADTALVAARTRLNLLIGLAWDAATDTEAITDSAASGEGSVVAPSVDELLSAGLSRRPELGAARSRVIADEAALRAARAALYPSVFITGDVTLADPNQRFFPQVDEFKATWSLGVLVSMDAGKVPATIAQAEQASARLRRETETLASAADTVTQEIVAAFLSREKARQQSRYAETYLALAEDGMRTARELYGEGVALDSDVADAEATLLSARLQSVNARIAVRKTASALRYAVGDPTPGIE